MGNSTYLLTSYRGQRQPFYTNEADTIQWASGKDGFTIKDTSLSRLLSQLAASGQWRLRIAIAWKANGMLIMQPFSGPTVYNSEEEADLQGIAFAQRIIDVKAGLKAGLRSK
jgi:hypothetical protein